MPCATGFAALPTVGETGLEIGARATTVGLVYETIRFASAAFAFLSSLTGVVAFAAVCVGRVGVKAPFTTGALLVRALTLALITLLLSSTHIVTFATVCIGGLEICTLVITAIGTLVGAEKRALSCATGFVATTHSLAFAAV